MPLNGQNAILHISFKLCAVDVSEATVHFLVLLIHCYYNLLLKLFFERTDMVIYYYFKTYRSNFFDYCSNLKLNNGVDIFGLFLICER